MALAHTILVIAYTLLRDGGTYQDLGPGDFDQLDRERVQRRLINRLESMGCRVIVEPLAETTA